MNDIGILKPSLKAKEPRGIPPSRLGGFFSPRSVAVIGASLKPGNQGKRIVDSLSAQGFPGQVTIVHPRGEAIPPYPAVRSVEELPEGTEVAIAVIPASHVPELVEPLAKRGVHRLIVISGGFAETGPAGEQLQEKLKAAGHKFGVRIIGPNCIGVFSAPDRFNSFFISPKEIPLPRSGSTAIISQSGSLLTFVIDRLNHSGVGVHKAVNFGNRVDVDECELLKELAWDPAVRVIGLYLESVKDGARFVGTAREVSAEKPVVVWKGGHGNRSGEAVRAHSASLAGSYEAFRAACDKAGLIEVQGLEEFSEALKVLSLQPAAGGRRTLIVSNGGGMGVHLADRCEAAGLTTPRPPQSAREKLETILPEYYSLQNPVDLTGSGTNEQCVLAVEHLLRTGQYDSLLLVLLAGAVGINPNIASLFRGRLPDHLPVVVGAYGEKMATGLKEGFHDMGIPVFDSADAAVRALTILVKRGELITRRAAVPKMPGERLYDSLPLKGWSKWFFHSPDEMESKELLKYCGVPIPLSRHLKTHDDLEEAIAHFGFPMVLKAVGSNITHKTDSKAIRLDVEGKGNLIKEWEDMLLKWPGAIWAEQQVLPGLDLMVGGHRDPQFGPLLVFGTGGKYVELFRDVARLLLPASEEELYELVFKTIAGKIIRGVRGEPGLDLKRLIELLKLVSDWMVQETDVQSMDFNPVRLYEHGLVVLDAKITLREST